MIVRCREPSSRSALPTRRLVRGISFKRVGQTGADSGDCDQPFRPKVITDSGDRDHVSTGTRTNGFVCPGFGGVKGWELSGKRFSRECAGCGQQTSVTAGTVMHRSKLPLTVWFTAIHLLSSHSNGISALQLQAQLGLGSYKSAWLLLHKLRHAMVDPHRLPLAELVEVDETEIAYRTRDDPPAGGQGRSHIGKLLLIGAVELSADRRPGRIRLDRIEDFSAASIAGFVGSAVAPAPRSSVTGCRPIAASNSTSTSARWSAAWPRMSCCRGSIGCSPTSSAGASAPFTGCGRPISTVISMSSSFAGIDGAIHAPPSTRLSA